MIVAAVSRDLTPYGTVNLHRISGRIFYFYVHFPRNLIQIEAEVNMKLNIKYFVESLLSTLNRLVKWFRCLFDVNFNPGFDVPLVTKYITITTYWLFSNYFRIR
jgi:hypothetical protein